MQKRIEDMIIFEDREILVCHKPAGLAVQNARIGTMDMESMVKNYLSLRQPENLRQPEKVPYAAVVHRLDQPVEGILVFAKTQKAAKELSAQISSGKMKKEYLAVTYGNVQKTEGILEDYLKKDGRNNTSSVVKAGTPGGKKARLQYRLVDKCKDENGKEKFLVRILLDTGRHHQIRVQMAHAGMPLAGDRKYGDGEIGGRFPGLCSAALTFVSPSSKKKLEFQVNPKGEAFRGFSDAAFSKDLFLE